MNFDLRGSLTLDPSRSQISRGGFAAVENCTWAALSDSLFDYGYGDHAPADLRELDNQLENLGAYAGGESWGRNLRVLAALAPDLAAVAVVEFPADVIAAVRAYAAQGFDVHWAGWCTTQATWTAGNLNGGISHAGRAVYGDGGGCALWNVWTGYLVYQPDGFWQAAYDGGGILVFKRPLGGPGGGDDLANSDEILAAIQEVRARIGDLENGLFPANPDNTARVPSTPSIEERVDGLINTVQPVVNGARTVPAKSVVDTLGEIADATTALVSSYAAVKDSVDAIRAGIDTLLRHAGAGPLP